jgi:hypothetical protein
MLEDVLAGHCSKTTGLAVCQAICEEAVSYFSLGQEKGAFYSGNLDELRQNALMYVVQHY